MIDQVAITILGSASVWLLATKRYRWGFAAGLLSEPFWLWTALAHRQWGIVLLVLIFTAGYANGLRTHWRQG